LRGGQEVVEKDIRRPAAVPAPHGQSLEVGLVVLVDQEEERPLGRECGGIVQTNQAHVSANLNEAEKFESARERKAREWGRLGAATLRLAPMSRGWALLVREKAVGDEERGGDGFLGRCAQ
jgi:hypothetical protein